ncbi:unnamed protein product [Didymodactylos carnosus]|uniref:Small ribosomal subunit protein mS23 n=1 Tax=Didymodactylos carnosus TaxID=1234261 RepID=A0A814EGN5_9BILA|nr:unnamed protein product [Didymodactylos carnosus]CAF0969243.1 unnamed protein product [Didymodactylos carnosus]CAF3565915.1 unnamed protein product [Didymodactylos carnosus]CAF3742416.1 unnamed protein product [Didymodactylos carnosus]
MSRLWKFGSIYSRVCGLIEGGQMKPNDRPLWLDVYKHYPPHREPRYLSLTEGNTPSSYDPPKLLYEEDKIRAQYYSDVDDNEIIKLQSTNNRKTRSQIFIEQYSQLKQQGISGHKNLFRLTLEAMQQNGHPIMFKLNVESKYDEDEQQSLVQDTLSSTNKNLNLVDAEHDVKTEWERNKEEGFFPLGSTTYQYRRLQPTRQQTTIQQEAVSDGNVTYRRPDLYKHSTVEGDLVEQLENPFMPGEPIQPLAPMKLAHKNLNLHGPRRNIFDRTEYEKDPFLRLQDKAKEAEIWKRPLQHTTVKKRKFAAKRFLVDIPDIYDKN